MGASVKIWSLKLKRLVWQHQIDTSAENIKKDSEKNLLE